MGWFSWLSADEKHDAKNKEFAGKFGCELNEVQLEAFRERIKKLQDAFGNNVETFDGRVQACIAVLATRPKDAALIEKTKANIQECVSIMNKVMAMEKETAVELDFELKPKGWCQGHNAVVLNIFDKPDHKHSVSYEALRND